MKTQAGKNYADVYSRDALEEINDWARLHAYPRLKRLAQDAEELERGSGRDLFADADRFAELARAIAGILGEPAAEQELAA